MHAAQILKGVPTRDVYVVRDNDGDREFAGFGRPTESYSDCFLDANSIPAEEISVSSHRLGNDCMFASVRLHRGRANVGVGIRLEEGCEMGIHFLAPGRGKFPDH